VTLSIEKTTGCVTFPWLGSIFWILVSFVFLEEIKKPRGMELARGQVTNLGKPN
jgi:hypothetical protein